MPKAGETPEMGANPLLGFGRVYARPEVARFIDSRVHRLLNDPSYGWDGFYKKMKDKGITIWGAAIDTLENTSRFAKGEAVGPMVVIHLYDQPLTVARPYEAYMGTLTLPRTVAEAARDHSIHLDLLSPRARVVEAIELAHPGIRRENIHVWTLSGKSREGRLSELWAEWSGLGAHLVEDGWICPSGLPAFSDSGTYAPTYLVGNWQDASGATHVFRVRRGRAGREPEPRSRRRHHDGALLAALRTSDARRASADASQSGGCQLRRAARAGPRRVESRRGSRRVLP
jgi:hypothetical protein